MKPWPVLASIAAALVVARGSGADGRSVRRCRPPIAHRRRRRCGVPRAGRCRISLADRHPGPRRERRAGVDAPFARCRPRDAGGEAETLGGDRKAARRDRSSDARCRGARRLCGLQGADRCAAGGTALPRLRTAADRGHQLLGRPGGLGARPVRDRTGLPRLYRDAGRAAALFRSERRQHARRAGPRLHPPRRVADRAGRRRRAGGRGEDAGGQPLCRAVPAFPRGHATSDAGGVARARGSRDPRCGDPRACAAAGVPAHRLHPRRDAADRRGGPARRQGLLRIQDPRIHDTGPDREPDPRNRAGGNREDPRADAGRDPRGGLRGRPARVPSRSAYRSALLPQDCAGPAEPRGVDRQDVRRQGVAILRSPAGAAASRSSPSPTTSRPSTPVVTAGRESTSSTPTTCRRVPIIRWSH